MANNDVKTCAKCRVTKPLVEFHRQKSGPKGRHSWCKVCWSAWAKDNRHRLSTPDQRARWNWMTRYKLSAKDVAALLASQNGNCAICERELKKFHIDHDHSTSKVRGLLCHRCNILIGGWDDAAWRMRAAAYLGLKQ